MRNVRPAFAFVLLVFVQSLCVLPGQAPAPITSTPISPEMAIAATQTAASSIRVTEAIQAIATPQAESVGTINLVLAQVQSGPPENLEFLEGIKDFYNGEAVRVTGGGKGKLNLNDGTQMTLFNGTEASDFTVTTAPRASDLFLQRQGFFGEVPEDGDVTVRLPNGASILIMGTRFFILYNEETQVATAGNFDGTVRYTPPGGTEEELPAGRLVNIPAQGAGVLMELPFTPQDFEAAVDSSGTPTAGLAALVQQYQIEPIVFTGEEVARATYVSGGSAAFSPDGRYVVSAGCDEVSFDCDRGSVRVWEALTGNDVAPPFAEESYLYSVTFSPDGKHVAFENGDGAVIVWNPFTGQEVRRLVEDGSGSLDFAFSPDGNYIVTGGPDDTVRIWEILTGNLFTSMIHESVWHVAFSPDGRYVVSEGQGDDTVRLWEVSTSSEIASMPQRAIYEALVFSPDGRYVASGGCDDGGQFCTLGYARVLDVSARREIASITHDGWVFSIAFSPDSKYIVSGSSGKGGDGPEEEVTGSLVIWEAATGAEIVRKELDSWVRCVDFSPDGDYVVFGTDDGNIRVWDAFTGREVAHMSHADRVNSVDFSPDGKYVLAASVDGVVQVWLWQPPSDTGCRVGC